VKTVTVRAAAKINLSLRVLAARPDGYHDVRTLLQSLALHDTLTCRAARGPLRLTCADPSCPADRTNLVWRAAEMLWRAAGRAGEPRDVVMRLVKRIPPQAGLGGGSSDGVAALRGLSALWRIRLPHGRLEALAAELGADAPFFLDGGTAIGVERGDLVFALVDGPAAWVVLVIPPFGVSTRDAYGWWDTAHGHGGHLPSPERESLRSSARIGNAVWASGGGAPREVMNAGRTTRGTRRTAPDLTNDLECLLAARHPEIAAIVRTLKRRGASHAAMSGSGSAVFGLFSSRSRAEAAVRATGREGYRTILTRTTSRARHGALSRPRMA